MQYFGGKSKIAKKIAAIINPIVAERDAIYIEPFVGGASVLCEINARARWAGDVNKSIITMFKRLQEGWEPPKELSEEEYHVLHRNDDRDSPLTAFAGFGCSFSGRYFQGYARNNRNTNFARDASNSLSRKLAKLHNVRFYHGDYTTIMNAKNCVIYCDPPYLGSKHYSGTEKFDNDKFWNFMRLIAQNNIVFISEYSAPLDFWPIMKIETKTDIRGNNGRIERTECLFVHYDLYQRLEDNSR